MTEWGLKTRGIIHISPRVPVTRGPHYHAHCHCSIITLLSHFITSDVSRDLVSIMANLHIHGGSWSLSVSCRKLKKSPNCKCHIEFNIFQWLYVNSECINFLGKSMMSQEWVDEQKKTIHFVRIWQAISTRGLRTRGSRVFTPCSHVTREKGWKLSRRHDTVSNDHMIPTMITATGSHTFEVSVNQFCKVKYFLETHYIHSW